MKHLKSFFSFLVCLLLSIAPPLLADSLIHFISEPKTVAQVNMLYSYKAVAVTPFMTAVGPHYKLTTSPEGMTIDSLSGLVEWTPATTGNYNAEVVAYQGGYKASQSFVLSVVNFLGTISGTVVNDSGEPLGGMWVLLYEQGNTRVAYRFGGFLWAWTDSSGHYAISNVDSGTYFAEAVTCNPVLARPCRISEYADVWYKDSPTRDGADSIPVLKSDTVVVNFTMHKKVFGTVFGKVVNDSDRALRGIFVTLFPQRVDYRRYIPFRVYQAATDSTGSFAITNVDTGTYFARASSLCQWRMAIICPNEEYADVWYKDSPDIYSATPIPVPSNGTVQVNLTMHKKIIPVPVKVSGTVTDTSGTPVGNAVIALLRFWKSPIVASNDGEPAPTNVAMTIDDDSFGDFENIAGYAKSDSSGKYSLALLSGGPYIAACFAHGYLLQFFNQKTNVLEADRITLAGDSAGFNFRLVPKPVAQWNMLGSVHDSAGSGIPSTVVLYRRGVPFFGKEFARCTHTDSTGDFTFENLPNGSYIAQAIPFHNYLPSFYSANACGVFRWKNADTIIVHNADVSGIAICVVPATASGGGTISGHVGTPEGISIAGVVIEAQSVSNAGISTYAITDASGNYTLALLNEGAYTITADKVGYESGQTQTNTVDYTQQNSPSDFQLKAEQTTSVGNPGAEIPESYALFQNYPNPFNPTTEIRYQIAEVSRVTLKIYNLLGQEVATLVSEKKSPGTYEVSFDGSSLPSGLYFYRLDAGNFSGVKKMLMLK